MTSRTDIVTKSVESACLPGVINNINLFVMWKPSIEINKMITATSFRFHLDDDNKQVMYINAQPYRIHIDNYVIILLVI